MARRCVFMKSDKDPYYVEKFVTFEWHGGFALSQSRENIKALHEAYLRGEKEDIKLLEVSSKSEDELGVQLSAFNLKKYVPSLDKELPVECIFQAGKVFENGGPYLDLLEMSPRDAKKDERLRNSGRLIAFEFEGERFPLEPKTYFYDYIYLEALKENNELAEQLYAYQGFTDIAFNPEKSINCQARTCAIFVGRGK